MLLCLGESSVRFLYCCCCCCSFLIFQRSSFYFIPFQATLPCHRHSWLLMPVKDFTSSELNPDYCWLPFLFHLPRALRFWVGIFYPQAFFTLCSFPTFLAHSQHFGTTCFYQSFTGSQQLLFWKLQGFILILKTQTRPICLFDSQ